MKIVVTGATSNVGAEVAVTLAARGHEVIAVALPGFAQDHLDRARIPLVLADILDGEAMARACDGASAIVHCAACIDFTARGRERSFRVNVEGNRVLARAARRAGLARFVHMSSAGVYGILTGGERVDEQTPTRATGHAYNDSKRDGEAALLDEAGPLAVTILRLTGVYGGFDRINIPATAQALRRRIYVYFGDPEKRHNLAGTRFVATAVSRFLEEKSPRAAVETFLVNEGDPPTYRTFVQTIADELALPRPRLALPAIGARALGKLFDGLDRLHVRPKLALPTALAENAIVDAFFDGSALRVRLDLAKVDPDTGIRAAVRALRANGRLGF